MFAIGATIIVNDPVDVFTHGRKATVKAADRYGHVTVYTVVDDRGWSFALRADKVKAA